MPKYKAKRLRDLIEGRIDGGPQQAAEWLQNGEDGQKPPRLRDFSIRDLAESFAGSTDWYKRGLARAHSQSGGFQGRLLEGRSLLEAGTPVSTADFQDILGQLLFSEVRDGFQQEGYKFSAIVPTMQSVISGTETVPEIDRIGDVADEVLEGEEYPERGYGHTRYTLPAGKKQGFTVSLTEESIFFDRTGRVADRARGIGTDLGLTKEKRIIDVLIGQVANYIRNDTSLASYLAAGVFVNASVIALADETDVDEVEQAQNDILDPVTGEPVELLEGEVQLICVPALHRLALRIARSTEVRQTTGGVETLAPPSLAHLFEVISSKQLYRRILAGPQAAAVKAKTWWFYGSIQKAMGWKENWGLEGFMQGPDGPEAFSRDVSMRWKIRYRGEAFMREPRYMYRAGDAS